MQPIKIQFGKLEFGTLFYDPITKDTFRKVSDTKALTENLGVQNARMFKGLDPEESFHPNETVIVP